MPFAKSDMWSDPEIGHPEMNMGGQRPRCKSRDPCEILRPRVQNLPARRTNHCILTQSQEDWTNPAMHAPSELNFEDMMRIRLEVLRREHRDLDEAVHVLEIAGRPDPLTLRRLKKQKLSLKDQIARLEDQLIPNIIA
jgi:hypothetical protein